MAHTGIMVALMLPEKDAQSLALKDFDGALPASDLHITLFMMGDVQDMPLESRGLLDAALKAWAANQYPLAVQIAGMGIFQSSAGSTDGNALILMIDSVQLDNMRDELEKIFAGLGISFFENHSFNPHITLAYLPKTSMALPGAVNIPESFVYLPELTLAWGDWRTNYPFKSMDDFDGASWQAVGTYTKEQAMQRMTELAQAGNNVEQIIDILQTENTTKAANFGAKMGQNIAGRLIRGAGGRFAGDGSAAPTKAPAKKAGEKPETPSKSATQAAKDKAKEEIAAAKKADKEEADSKAEDEMYQRFGDTLVEIGADPDFVEVMSVGDYPGDIAGANPETQKKLADAGLGQVYPDGTFDLTPTGRTLVKAAKAGNTKMAKRALATAQALQNKKKAAAAKAASRKKTKKEFDVETSPLGTTFKVYQQADGKYRWFAQSSSAFKDKDGHYVTLKSLSDDVARADQTKAFGTLRYWHTDGVDIGTCDYNAMHGAILIESGIFTNNEIAQALATSKKEWGISLGFKNFTFEPGNDGTFNYIQRFERSVLPLEKASNWFTKLFVTEKEKDMEERKFKELVDLLNGDVEAAQRIVSGADKTQKQAVQAGATFKEVQTPPADQTYVAEMTPEELNSHIAAQVQTGLQPVLDAINGLGAQQTQKESSAVTALTATVTGLAAQVTALTETVKGLTGETSKSYRASQSGANLVAEEQQAATLKSKAPAPDPRDDFFSALQILPVA